jgi:hypothetical protein
MRGDGGCALQASGSGLFFNVSVSDCCLMRACGYFFTYILFLASRTSVSVREGTFKPIHPAVRDEPVTTSSQEESRGISFDSSQDCSEGCESGVESDVSDSSDGASQSQHNTSASDSGYSGSDADHRRGGNDDDRSVDSVRHEKPVSKKVASQKKVTPIPALSRKSAPVVNSYRPLK